MAAISSGVARSFESLMTETRYCISDHLPWSWRLPRAPLTLATNTPAPIGHRPQHFSQELLAASAAQGSGFRLGGHGLAVLGFWLPLPHGCGALPPGCADLFTVCAVVMSALGRIATAQS